MLMCGAMLLVGCSGDAVPADGAEAATREPLSAGEHCDTATPADHEFDAARGIVTTPNWYDHTDCRFAYLADYVAPQDPSDAFVIWADTLPATQTSCTLANLRFYAWDLVPKWVTDHFEETGTLIQAASLNATWTSGRCTFPQGGICAPAGNCGTYFKPGHLYRFAVSARQGNPDGSWALRSAALGVMDFPTLTGTPSQ